MGKVSRFHVIFVSLIGFISSPSFSVPYPDENYALKGTAMVNYHHAEDPKLASDFEEAYRKIHRVAYAVENLHTAIENSFPHSINIPVLLKNWTFYKTRFDRRFTACDQGKTYFKYVGRCNTANERRAYVNVTFGYVRQTIHLCDEYFEDQPYQRVITLLHECGRLEGIGDSEDFDSDSIAVWDSLVGTLSSDLNFEALQNYGRRPKSEFLVSH